MIIRHLLYTTGIVLLVYLITLTGSGCAQIGSPTGGPKDSLPPILITALPKLNTTNFKGNKITLVFDEYIDVQEVQANVLVSPFPKTNPQIDFKLKTVTIKIKDTLLPNTTYAINFGNAIRDNNEGNPYKNFTYVFSTGATIDSMRASGKIVIAETGKLDTTIIAMLYRNVHDTIVQSRKPDYIAKLDGSGKFEFTNLSAGSYKLYALKDGDGGKTYNSKIELFAFAENELIVSDSTPPVNLYAYAEERDTKTSPATATLKSTSQADKKLRYTSNLEGSEQDLLNDLSFTFNKALKLFDTQKINLTDTNNNPITATITLDSTRKIMVIKTKWEEGQAYRLLLSKDAASDSTDVQLSKADTIRFFAKKFSDYGNIVLRFSNLAAIPHPVLQFMKGEIIFRSVAITTAQWSEKLFPPGEYELRILNDANNNGFWDTGNYSKKLQPEQAVTLDTKLVIKANWDNERDIKL